MGGKVSGRRAKYVKLVGMLLLAVIVIGCVVAQVPQRAATIAGDPLPLESLEFQHTGAIEVRLRDEQGAGARKAVQMSLGEQPARLVFGLAARIGPGQSLVLDLSASESAEGRAVTVATSAKAEAAGGEPPTVNWGFPLLQGDAEYAVPYFILGDRTYGGEESGELDGGQLVLSFAAGEACTVDLNSISIQDWEPPGAPVQAAKALCQGLGQSDTQALDALAQPNGFARTGSMLRVLGQYFDTAEFWRVSLPELEAELQKGPCIIYIRPGHYVCALACDEQAIAVDYPGRGRVRISKAQLADWWAGWALRVGKPPGKQRGK